MKELNPERFRPQEPLVTQDMDGMECGNPGCQAEHPLFLVASCHQGAGADVSYVAGVMTVRCHECSLVVCKVKVATAEVQ